MAVTLVSYQAGLVVVVVMVVDMVGESCCWLELTSGWMDGLGSEFRICDR